jgi:hypothetical protein
MPLASAERPKPWFFAHPMSHAEWASDGPLSSHLGHFGSGGEMAGKGHHGSSLSVAGNGRCGV